MTSVMEDWDKNTRFTPKTLQDIIKNSFNLGDITGKFLVDNKYNLKKVIIKGVPVRYSMLCNSEKLEELCKKLNIDILLSISSNEPFYIVINDGKISKLSKSITLIDPMPLCAILFSRDIKLEFSENINPLVVIKGITLTKKLYQDFLTHSSKETSFRTNDPEWCYVIRGGDLQYIPYKI